MEERLRILKLLEQGKINAEEAARLLEALSDRQGFEHRPYFSRKMVMPDMEKIFETVNSAIATAFGERGVQKELKFKGKKLLEISSVSGDIEVTGTDQPEMSIRATGSGFKRVREEDSEVKLHYLSNDLEVSLPKTAGLKLRTVSGDVRIKDYDGTCALNAVSGDVELKNIAGSLKLNTVSGDIEGKDLSAQIEIRTKSGDIGLDFSHVNSVDIETRTGDVELVIPKESSLTLSLVTGAGKIECDPLITTVEHGKGYLTGKIGGGKGCLKITVEDKGNISIKTK